LFPIEDEAPMPPELESAIDSSPTVTVPTKSVTQEIKPRDEPDGKIKDSVGTAFVQRLLSILDRTIFPNAPSSVPGGSRRARLERWRIALGSCDGKPEALYAALAKCDPAITKGTDGQKVLVAIRSWYAEMQH
jgi:hypothetical protein